MNICKLYRTIFFIVNLSIFHVLIARGGESFITGKVYESVVITTDRDLYIAGEPILFSVEYFVNGSKGNPQLSNIIYVELISVKENKPLLQKKYKLTNLHASGVLTTPSNVASGAYAVTAYTQYQRNFPEEVIGYHAITILNSDNGTFIEARNSVKNLEGQPDSAFIFSKNDANILIGTEKEDYRPREKVKARISYKSAENNEAIFASVSVVKQGTQKEDHGVLPAVCSGKYSENSTLPKNSKLKYVPEIRDVSISGILRNKQTLEPVANHSVYCSVLFNNPQLHVNKTKDDGTFIFSLNNLSGINDVFLSPEVVHGDKNEYELLLNNPFSNNYAEFWNQKSFIDTTDFELVRDLFVNAQIRKKFCAPLQLDTISRNKSSFSNISEFTTSILLSDFVSLKSMEELFTEIVDQVRYKKIRNQYSFIVFDNNGNVISESPLLLLDKIPIFNPNTIMEIDISQIEKLEVINRPYVLGENTFQGILSFSTRNNDFAGISLPNSSVFIEFQGIERDFDKTFFNRNRSAGETRIPDFRTTLYWNPHIELTADGVEVEFNCSDATGLYNIVVKGFHKSGQPFYSNKSFNVGF